MTQPADLLELQSIDVEIVRATKRLDELPEKRAILDVRAKEREAQALGDKADMLVRKLESEVKARQDEVTMIQAKIDQEQTKLMSTTDHRSVQAITREMDGLKRRCDKLEMEELQFMERAEKARSQVAAVRDHVSKLAEKETQLIEQFKDVGGGVQKQLNKLQKRRNALAKSMPVDVLARYESVKEAKGGVAVGKLEGQMCSACRMDLPSTLLQTLKEGPEIGICPQCRRLIVVRGVEE